MDAGLYAATTGLEANVLAQEVIAHNLANVSTTGYKRRLALFQPFHALLAQEQLNGTQPDGIVIDFSEGVLQHTGAPLHLALRGKGFFVVRGPQGEELLTRNGSFTLDSRGRIVDHAGRAVLGTGGELTVPPGATITVGEDGTIGARGDEAESVRVGQVRIAAVAIEDRHLLRPAPHAAFAAPRDVLLAPAEGAAVLQGFLERSNTSAIDELVAMISTLRSFEAAQRTVRSIDQSLDELNKTASQS